MLNIGTFLWFGSGDDVWYDEEGEDDDEDGIAHNLPYYLTLI